MNFGELPTRLRRQTWLYGIAGAAAVLCIHVVAMLLRSRVDGLTLTLLVEGAYIAMFVALLLSFRKRAYYRIRHAESWTDALIEEAPLSIFVHQDGRFVYVNAQGVRTFGLASPDELMGQPILNFVHSEDQFTVQNRIKNIEENNNKVASLLLKAVRADGAVLYTESIAVPIHFRGDPAILVIAQDVTHRVQSEQRLRDSEERYRFLVEQMPDAIWTFDEQGRLLTMNPAAKSMTGYGDAVPFERLSDLSHPEDAIVIDRCVEQALEGCISTVDVRLVRMDGAHRIASVKFVPIQRDDQVMSAFAVARDVTSERQLESQLVASENRYRNLVEQAAMGVFVYEEGSLTYANPRFLQIFGLQESQLSDVNVLDLLHDEDKSTLLASMRNHLRTDRRFQYTVRGKSTTDHSLYLQISGSLVNQSGRTTLCGIVEDITEQMMAQEMIQRSERLSVVGQLAASVAHEVRNPLTSIRGFLQLLQPSLSQQEASYVDIVFQELARVNEIITQFLYAARPSDPKFDIANLHELLKDVTTLVNTQALMGNIEVIASYAPISPAIYCDEHQIKQLVLNLLKNAIEAMPKGGRLELKTEVSEDNGVLVSVTDNGVGIPSESLPKLGEPFFTTKDAGTGLGLMVCHRIVRAHHGEMGIRSKVNEGTTVTIRLPVESWA